jgi:hypothetical protein
MKYSEAPVELTLGPSRLALRVIAAMALATLAVLAATPGAAWLRILLATWIACAALEAIHAVALHRGRRGARRVVVTMAGEVHLCGETYEWRTGSVRPGSFVAPWLTILRWRSPTHRFDRALLILPDMLPEDDFRRLRVLLRWGL